MASYATDITKVLGRTSTNVYVAMKRFSRFQMPAYLARWRERVDHTVYEKIQDEESSEPSEHGAPETTTNIKPRYRVAYSPAVYVALFLGWTIIIFRLGAHYPVPSICNKMTTAWSPAQSIIRFEEREIRAEFWTPSPYRGAGASVDKAWHDLIKIGDFPIHVDESQLVTLGKDPARKWKRLPDSLGGGIAGYPEVFHQLHCLNLIRMATYPELYSNHTDFADYEPRIVRAHTDHCIELMRLHLQCTSEMTPVLTEELPGDNTIQSDFNMLHMCKNFEELKDWTKKNALHQIQPTHMGH